MRNNAPYLLFLFLLCVLFVSGIACHLIFPLQALPAPDTHENYFCSAEIYRTLAGGSEEFTEIWQCYVTAANHADAIAESTTKLNDYINDYMAPGFEWHYRNLTAAVSTSMELAADCEYTIDDLQISPPTYGAPFGAELRWNYPPSTEGYVYVSLVDKDGTTRTATPQVANAYADFAERTGLPDGGTYDPATRHLRFSNLYVELSPFALGDMSVTKFYIQSIGTVIAEDVGGTSYRVDPYNSKYFLYAHGEKSGESGTTSFCFTNEYFYGFTEYQGPPNPYFTFSVSLDSTIIGQNMLVQVSLSKPAAPYSFKTHQPYVAVQDKTVSDPQVNLTPDLAWDADDNLDKYLWFENFEAANEIYLGSGALLEDVPFSVGVHKVTVVAYDTYGAYNSASMELTVPNFAPKAVDETYVIDEDTTLVRGAPGVLSNDTDANGDSLTAVKLTDPVHGTVALSANGSFTYTPDADFNGSDTFTYVANDGSVDSNTGSVTIIVNPVNDSPVAVADNFTVKEDHVLNIASPGILSNDLDVDGDILTAIKVTNPSHGSLTLNSNGSFTYAPVPNYFGTDSFTYKANDGSADSDPVSVTIGVIEVPPDEEGKDFKDLIPPLVADNTLNAGQANSLASKMDQFIAKILAGQNTPACNLLKAILNEINALVSGGILAPAEAQPLIDKVKNIQAELSC